MLENVRQRLPAIFTSLGVLSLAISAGLYLVYQDLNRWVLTSAAIGVIFLVYAVLERPEVVRGAVTARETRYGGNTLLLTIAFVGIVALLNVLSARHTFRWDITEGKDFSVSPQTIQILRGLTTPIKVTAFYPQGSTGQEDLQDLLKEYQRYTDKITYEVVDPELKPGIARDYRIESYPTTVIESNGQRQTITGATEGDLTSALLKVERGAPKKVGWVTGHGELDPNGTDRNAASEAKRLIERENYKVEPLPLASIADVPEDVAVVVLAGPRQPLLPQEIDVLQKYLDRGGKMLALVDPRSPGNPTDLLGRWGIEVGDGIVLDFTLNLQGDPLTPAVVKYQPNPIMRAVDQSGRYITVFPGATMVRPKKEREQSLQVQVIADSSPDKSWLESDARIDLRSVAFDEGKDVRGPVPMAVSVTRAAPPAQPAADTVKPPSTRIVAIGNSTFLSNSFLSVIQVPGNRDLLLNSINWLAEDEQLMSVRSRSSQDRSVLLTAPQQNLLLASSTLFLPLGVMAIGAVVWWRRR